LLRVGLVRAGLVWAGLVWAGLYWVRLLRVAAETVLCWIEVVEGHDGQEAAMLRPDCVSFEIGLLTPHKPDHGLLVFV